MCKSKAIIFLFVLLKSGNCANEFREKFTYLYEIDTNRTQSEKCLDLMFHFPINGTIPMWAIQMLDATAKLQPGLMSGNVMNLGDYDECLSINYPQAGVKGKYCLAAYDLQIVPLIYGICLPDVCNLGAMLPYNENLLIRDDLCQTNETILDGGDIFCILVIVFSILLMFVATIYEIRKMRPQASEGSRVLIAFSMYSNSLKLFKINPSEISCLYGIRVFSMLWIIFAHRATIMMGIPTTNILDVVEMRNSHKASYIYASNFAVDTFFFIVGFLVAYNVLKFAKGFNVSTWLPFIMYRWMRTFPSIAVLFLISNTIARHLGSGPLYKLGIETGRYACKKYWWSYFLFIQNYVNYDSLCLMHTWFLSVDLQMYVLSPLVLIPLGKLLMERKTCTIRLMFTVLLTLTIFIPMFMSLTWRSTNIYTTETRLSVYLIGIYGGMKAVNIQPVAMKLNGISKIAYWIMWIIVLVTMLLVCTQSRYSIEQPASTAAIMLATFGRPIWAIGLLWIILNCMTGNCPLINQILSLPLFEVTSRLNFAMYLLHNLVIGHHSLSIRSSLYISEPLLIKAWISDIIITTFFAYFWTMLYESPIFKLIKLLLKKIGKDKERYLARSKDKHSESA